MDLLKEFNSVKHSILIKQTKATWDGENTLKWFESYLNNWFQFVEIKHILQKIE